MKMKQAPYNPFEFFTFKNDICFLTGKQLEQGHTSFVPVIPSWLIERYQLENALIVMLGGHRMKYKDMMLPVSIEAKTAIEELDAITREAFEIGYEAVVKLPEITIFQWMTKVLYGVLYQEIAYDIEDHQAKNKVFSMSAIMSQKLKNLHLMLQSLIRPVRFEGFTPWSMKINPVKISKDILNYKDETRKLNFCLNMNGFGIVACLQDNGEVAKFYEEDLEVIGAETLHPVQFEELYGRFIYANYLLRELPDYDFSEDDDGTIVFHLPQVESENLPKMAEWSDDTYAQVLANLWQPWGISQQMVYVFPNSPISYLINEVNHQFIKPEFIKLDY